MVFLVFYCGMRRHIDDFIGDVNGVRDVAALRTRFSDAISRMGFFTFVYGGMHIPQLDDNTTPYIVSTFPDDWQERYYRQEYYRSDPIIAGALHSVLPTQWSDMGRIGMAKPQANVMNEARDHGLEHGFAVPVHGHGGEFGLTSVVSNESGREFQRLLRQHAHDLHLMSIYFHSAIQDVINGQRDETKKIRLTPRETECLLWSVQGKTSWEVSVILHVSEATVNFHIRNAMKKLGVYSKAHAIAKTLVLGLILP